MKKESKPPKAINKVIDRLVLQNGGINADIAKKLSEHSNKRVSPQRIGQYRKTGKQPGPDFLLLWSEVYGDNILELTKQHETNVSRETKGSAKLTHGGEPAGKQKNLPYSEEREILIRNIDRIGETNEYLLKRIKELGG